MAHISVYVSYLDFKKIISIFADWWRIKRPFNATINKTFIY